MGVDAGGSVGGAWRGLPVAAPWDLPQGGRLPNERDLAAEYGVAVGTARRAVRELAARELVRIMPGRGVVVRPRD